MRRELILHRLYIIENKELHTFLYNSDTNNFSYTLTDISNPNEFQQAFEYHFKTFSEEYQFNINQMLKENQSNITINNLIEWKLYTTPKVLLSYSPANEQTIAQFVFNTVREEGI